MRLRTVTGLIALLVGLPAGSNSAEAQGPGPWVHGAAPGGYVVDQTAMQQSDPSKPFGTRYRLYSEFGDGVGFKDGQTYVNVFHPIHINPYTDLVFIDGRIFGGHSEDSVFGGNAGIGYRRIFGYAVAGVSGWVDAVSVEEDHSRLGVSAEVVLPYLEMRANGYFGLGDQSRDVSTIASGVPTFVANQIVFTNQAMSEFQYDGFDAELGGPIPGLPNLSAYFGGYYIETDDGQESGGFRFRAEAHVNRNVQLGLQVSDDKIFDTNVFGTVALTLPTGPPSRWWDDGFFRPRDGVDHLARQVDRQYRIPVESRVRSDSVAAINPADGDPFFVIHIDPSRTGGGDGTFENPFGQNALGNDPNADIIRVLPGTLSTNGPIALFNTQRLLAATRAHTVTTATGSFLLPDQRSGTVTLTNALGGNTVVLANNNEVSGFTFAGTGVGISGTNIAGYNLNNNVFNGLTTGIQLVNATTGSPALVDSSTFTGNGTGLSVTSTPGGVSTVVATNNTFTNNTGSGILLTAAGGDTPAAAATTLNATLDGNTTSGNGNMGLRAVGSGQNSTLNLTAGVNAGNVSTNDVDAGFGVFAQDRAVVNATFQNSTISGTVDNAATAGNAPTGDGIYIERMGGSLLTVGIGDSIPTNGLGGNAISGTAGDGIRYIGAGADQLSTTNRLPTLVHIDEATISNTGGDNIEFNQSADNVLQAVVVNSDLSNAGLAGIRVANTNNSSFGAPTRPTTGEDRNGDGILQAVEDVDHDGVLDTTNSMLSSVFDSNRISNSTSSGITGSTTSGAFTDVRISGTQQDASGNQLRTTITNAGVDGILWSDSATQAVANNSQSVYRIEGTDITGTAIHGIHLINVAGSKTYILGGPFNGQNVLVSGSGSEGIDIDHVGGASAFVLNNVISSSNGNAALGGMTVSHTGGSVLFNVTDSRFVDNVGTGATIDVRTTLGFANYNFGNEDASYNFAGTASSPNAAIDGYALNNGAAGGTTSTYEDTNRNGVLDPGEDVNGNGVLDFNEDVNGDGDVADLAGNWFNNNGGQGVYYQTFSPITLTAATTTTVDILSPAPVQTFLGSGLYAEQGSLVFVQSRLNFFGNQVLNNGLAGVNQVDGMVLGVGTNTNLIAAVSNNVFGGNTLSDFRVAPLVSSDPINGTNNAVAGPPVLDRVALDPTGVLDLAFGQNFTVVAPVPPNSPVLNGNGGNVGENLDVRTIGSATPLFGRTETGVFGNADFVKPAGRSAFIVLNVYTAAFGGLDDVSTGGVGSPGNLFSQLPPGVRPVRAHFLGANNVVGGVANAAFNTVGGTPFLLTGPAIFVGVPLP